jgi:CRISPR-associated Csx3 family protein
MEEKFGEGIADELSFDYIIYEKNPSTKEWDFSRLISYQPESYWPSFREGYWPSSHKREVPVINNINDITKEEDLMINNDILNISDLADACSKAPIKRTLPNGKEIEQITWEGSDMKTINQLLHEKDKPDHVKIDGAAPAWLVAGICHELHPSSCSVNTPQGYIPVGCKPPNGAGSGENLQFQSKQSGDWTVIEVSQKDSSIPLDLNKLSDIEPPEIEMGSKVILSGRMPNVAMCSMANAYQHKAKAIGFYQPNVGATVSITHDPEIELGSVIPDELIKQEERRTKLNNLINPTQNPISKV